MHRQRFHSPDSSPAQPTGFLTIPSPNEFANGKFQGASSPPAGTPLLAEALEVVRSVRAVKSRRWRLRGPQTSTGTDGPLLTDSLEGVRSVGTREGVSMSATGGCEGPQTSGSSWTTVDEGPARASCDSPDDEFIHFRMRDGLCAVPFFSLL
jgi:hypothetical protein